MAGADVNDGKIDVMLFGKPARVTPQQYQDIICMVLGWIEEGVDVIGDNKELIKTIIRTLRAWICPK